MTLDTDTRLPRDTVRRLIGKMAHPLNRPRLDPDGRRVVEGYAVLQPRVTPSLPIGREGSLFQRIFSSVSGIDPYASAVSDVYQDLFGEGSYAGKGIYDVDAFEAALANRAPDSTLLSHDLFEGVFARAGLASDIEVVEEFPARYDVGAIRHHRWARGDWQLLPWIFGRAPEQRGTRKGPSALPAIGRWKMLDNLRRTVSAPAAVLALLVGWTLSISPGVDLDTVCRHDDRTADAHSGRCGHSAASPGRNHLEPRACARRRCKPCLGHFDADYRVPGGSGVAHGGCDRSYPLAPRGEPSPSARMDSSRPGDDRPSSRLAGFCAPNDRRNCHWGGRCDCRVDVSPWVLAIGASLRRALACVACYRPLCKPRSLGADGRLVVAAADAQALRQTARRTWLFFETFVTSADNMLPPDNFQDDPAPAVAHRTSPTNIGLYLLSVVCARDFGWIGTGQAIERLEATLATMGRLQRMRGHLYNWYDTRDLRAPPPEIYIDRRQRQSGGAPHRARQRVPRMGRPSPQRVGPLQRRRRRAGHHAGRMCPAARRPKDPDRDLASARRRPGRCWIGFTTGFAFASRLSDPARQPPR